MFDTIETVLVFIAILGLLIFFHELGHFLVARMFNMGVRTFSLGFGKKVWSYTKGQTEYCLSILPLGGYVQLAGEHDDEPVEGFSEAEMFSFRPAWQRLCVVAAGPIFNFVLAFLLYWMLVLNLGISGTLPEVGKVLEDSPAAAAKLQPSDVVTAVNGKQVRFFKELRKELIVHLHEEVIITVNRNDTLFDLPLTPMVRMEKNFLGAEEPVPLIGFQLTMRKVSYPVEGGGLPEALDTTLSDMRFMVDMLEKLVSRSVPASQLGGPILIAQVVHENKQGGIWALLQLAAFLSVNLGVINLLPIPVLDGGHIMFFGLEMILRKPVNEKFQALAMRLGTVLLATIMILAVFNDLRRIIFG